MLNEADTRAKLIDPARQQRDWAVARRTRVATFLISLVSILVPSLVAGSGEVADWDQPDEAWRKGPVSCILTREEDKAFKALKTNAGRKSAIDAFWARRDPSPGTERNEYREVFYTRVNEVPRYAHGTTAWVGDQGKMFLILGRPDHVSLPTWGEVWTYTRTFPSGKGKWAGKRVTVEVAFEKYDYKMSQEGAMLLGAVRSLDPLEAAKLSLSHP